MRRPRAEAAAGDGAAASAGDTAADGARARKRARVVQEGGPPAAAPAAEDVPSPSAPDPPAVGGRGGRGGGSSGGGDGSGSGSDDEDEPRLPASASHAGRSSAAAAGPASLPAPAAARSSAALLPWMRRPVGLMGQPPRPLEAVAGLDPRLAAALRRSGVTALFPVQAALWRELAAGGRQDRDVCVAAPTGSGKTLAYALPLLQSLCGRALPRLRALLVLPTSELAQQVNSVLAPLAAAVRLRCATLTAARGPTEADASGPSGGISGVDILIATPGRLVSALCGPAPLCLSSLRWLVVDEADRLLRQSYHHWTQQVRQAVAAAAAAGQAAPSSRPAQEGASAAALGACAPGPCPELGRSPPGPRVVQLLLSATLPRDPAKLARLSLHRPLLLSAAAEDQGAARYSLPSRLLQYRLVIPAADKPRALLAVLMQLHAGEAAQAAPSAAAVPAAAGRAGPAGPAGGGGERGGTLIFTASIAATHRLYLLLRAYAPLAARVAEFGSHQSAGERAAALAAFRAGAAQVLVASDAMTRGMDVSRVDNVINYDVPVYAKTYVHRVGRTARAGAAGTALTLLRHQEARHFKTLLRKTQPAAEAAAEQGPGGAPAVSAPAALRTWHLGEEQLAAVAPAYERALRGLADALEAERARGTAAAAAAEPEAAALIAEQSARNWRAAR